MVNGQWSIVNGESLLFLSTNKTTLAELSIHYSQLIVVFRSACTVPIAIGIRERRTSEKQDPGEFYDIGTTHHSQLTTLHRLKGIKTFITYAA